MKKGIICGTKWKRLTFHLSFLETIFQNLSSCRASMLTPSVSAHGKVWEDFFDDFQICRNTLSLDTDKYIYFKQGDNVYSASASGSANDLRFNQDVIAYIELDPTNYEICSPDKISIINIDDRVPGSIVRFYYERYEYSYNFQAMCAELANIIHGKLKREDASYLVQKMLDEQMSCEELEDQFQPID